MFFCSALEFIVFCSYIICGSSGFKMTTSSVVGLCPKVHTNMSSTRDSNVHNYLCDCSHEVCCACVQAILQSGLIKDKNHKHGSHSALEVFWLVHVLQVLVMQSYILSFTEGLCYSEGGYTAAEWAWARRRKHPSSAQRIKDMLDFYFFVPVTIDDGAQLAIEDGQQQSGQQQSGQLAIEDGQLAIGDSLEAELDELMARDPQDLSPVAAPEENPWAGMDGLGTAFQM